MGRVDSRVRLEVQARVGAHLQRRGLRWSSTRDVVVRTFLDSPHHLTVDELVARVRRREPGVGHATVHRTLRLLEEIGVALSHRFGEGPTRYEPAAGVPHHDHLVCTACGRLVEFVEPGIERLQEQVSQAAGFLVHAHRLEIHGRCPDCRRAAREVTA